MQILYSQSNLLPFPITIVLKLLQDQNCTPELPNFLVTLIIQLRLGYNTVFVKGEWHDLSPIGNPTMCKFCGQKNSLHHLVDKCTNFQPIRNKLLPEIPLPLSLMDAVNCHVKNPIILRKIYVFLTICMTKQWIDYADRRMSNKLNLINYK